MTNESSSVSLFPEKRSQKGIGGTAFQRSSSQPNRVVYIISDLSVGGAETVLYRLLSATDQTQWEPVVILLMEGGMLREPIEELGIEVYALKINRKLPTPLDLWRLIRLLRRLQPDVVVGWMYYGCLAAQLANFFLPRSVSVVWSIHYSIASLKNEKPMLAAAIRICAYLSGLPARIVFVSHDGQAKHDGLGFNMANSCVIANGISPTPYMPSPEARALTRAELDLSPESLLIGMVSRYHPTKDYANFLQAAALISQKHPETHFLLVGAGVDEDNSELRRMIEELGLNGRAHLVGERHDIPRLMAALDIFSLSSYCGDSFPTVITEAMACAIPCVVTDVGDAALIVSDSGCVVPPRDPQALTDAWLTMIELGEAGRNRLGRFARKRVLECFPLKTMVHSYESLYKMSLAEKTPVAKKN